MKCLVLGFTVVIISFSANAAPNVGLPSFSAQSITVIDTAKSDAFSDMATIDKLISEKRYAEAIPVLEHYLASDEASVEERSIGHNLKGLSLYMVGRIAEAIEDFTISLDIQHRAPIGGGYRWKTIFNRGLAYEAAKNLSRAADDFVRAYALAPDERRVKNKIFNFFNKE
tara:strand:+ start:4520 stop:5029 length:510 start_codon:yes stop_codon:yes gene_type:complete